MAYDNFLLFRSWIENFSDGGMEDRSLNPQFRIELVAATGDSAIEVPLTVSLMQTNRRAMKTITGKQWAILPMKSHTSTHRISCANNWWAVGYSAIELWSPTHCISRANNSWAMGYSLGHSLGTHCIAHANTQEVYENNSGHCDVQLDKSILKEVLGSK